MPRILVTGGLGFIGSHTVVALIEKDYEVIIVDNLSNSSEKVLDGIVEITGVRPVFYPYDLTNNQLCKAIFEKEKIDGVIHFAAYKAVGESVENPLMYYHNNLVSMLNVLQSMKENNVTSFIFSSSCTVYGQAETLPISEESDLKTPESPYGKTKLLAENILKDIAIADDMNVILLRYFNPIGAHPSALIGELPIGVPNNLVPYITQTAIGEREVLSVFGDDYPTKDGTCIRDYIHVCDLADAHIIALERTLYNKNVTNLEYYNLGTGKGFSVLELVHTFEKVTNQSLPYQIAPRRKGDVVAAYAEIDKANSVLGWKAERTIDEMLLSAWNWQKKVSSK